MNTSQGKTLPLVVRSLPIALLGAVLASACNPKGVEFPAELTVTPEQLDFGTVGVEGEATLEITIENTGGSEAALLSLTLTEGDPDIYSVDRNGVEEIDAGEQQLILVTFRPDGQTLFTGQVQLRTDVSDQTSFLVTLLGRGGPSDEDYDGDGYSVAAGDCDDGNPNINPGADEVCDGFDNDCNGVRLADEIDDDYDGWLVCEGDCDDANGNVNPGANEICDGLDNNCDLAIPDNDDLDLDGYSLCDGDCDDTLPQVNPYRPEICDGVDNDCDGNTDNVDNDLDGHTVCSAAGDCDDDDPNAYPVVVSENGSAYGAGTDDDPYDSIALALSNLDTVCRTVVLEPGDYELGANWTAGSVTLIGRTGIASDVTLQQDYGGARIFTITGGAMVLQDLTIADSVYGEDGGAISVTNAALTLDDVVLIDNESYNDGGALAAVSSTITLQNGCRFENNNAADDGGALLLDSSTVNDDGTLYLANSGARGGALYIVGGTVSIDSSEFRGNAASIEGGAAAITGTGTISVERSWLVSNSAQLDGGALALRDVSSAGWFRNNRIQDNTALAAGGGFAVLGNGSLRIVNNTLTGNEATGNGSAVAIVGPGGTAVDLLANLSHSNDGPSAFYADSVGTASHNTGYLTNSGVHFAGAALVDLYGVALDATNLVRNPLLVYLLDDGNPDNDDLALQGGSPEIDSGPPDPVYNDRNGTQNDRGFSGGPGAP